MMIRKIGGIVLTVIGGLTMLAGITPFLLNWLFPQQYTAFLSQIPILFLFPIAYPVECIGCGIVLLLGGLLLCLNPNSDEVEDKECIPSPAPKPVSEPLRAEKCAFLPKPSPFPAMTKNKIRLRSAICFGKYS